MDLAFYSSTELGAGSLVAGVLHALIAGAVTFHVLLNKRDVSAAIGWIGIAWLSPVFGALFYLGFGINRVKRKAQRLRESADGFPLLATGDVSSMAPLERLKLAVGNITGQEMKSGRVAAILKGGDQAYPRMLAAIDAAKVSVTLSTYIFRADQIGTAFIAALVRAQRRGVRTRVLIDGFGGGFLLSSSYRRLRAQGVPVARFLHSFMPWRMSLLDMRLHKKSLVIDGAAAFVGGLNIGAENVIALRPRSPVRDMHFRVEGDVVRQIEEEFDDDWVFTTGAPATEPDRSAPPQDETAPDARTILAGPDEKTDPLVLVLLSAISLARRSIRIATPYFLPDDRLVTALQLAALRGVTVTMVFPSVNNHRVVAWAARAHVRPLLEAGCRLWRSPPPFDHSKLMTIDGAWSLIGSANWDTRSLRLNFELTVEFYDADFASRIEELIDARCVEPVTLQEIDGRKLPVKLRDAAARLLMPYI